MSTVGKTAAQILAEQGKLGQTAAHALYGKRRRKKEEEEREPSLPQELIESYERRLRAIGIEPPERTTHRGETKRAWWQKLIFTPLQKVLAVLDWPGNIVRSVVGELIAPEHFEGNILSALGESIIRKRHVSGFDILQAELKKQLDYALKEKERLEQKRSELTPRELKYLEHLENTIRRIQQPSGKDKAALFTFALLADIGLDPLTYTGFGVLTKTGKAAETAKRLSTTLSKIAGRSKELAEILDTVEDVSGYVRYADEIRSALRKIGQETAEKAVAKQAARAEKLLDTVLATKPATSLAPTAAEQARLGQRALLSVGGVPVVKGAPVFEAGRQLRLATANLPGIRQIRELVIPGAKMKASSRFTPELAEEVLHRWRVAEPAALARTEERVKGLTSLIKELGLEEPAKRVEALKLIESPGKVMVKESLEEVKELVPRTLTRPMRATKLETASATKLFALKPYRDLGAQYDEAVKALKEMDKIMPEELPEVGRRTLGAEVLPEKTRAKIRELIRRRDEAVEEAIRRTKHPINREAFQRLKIYHEIDDYRRGIRTELSDEAVKLIGESGGDLRKAVANAKRSLIARGQAIVREEYDVVKVKVPAKRLERVEREVPEEIRKLKEFWDDEAEKLLQEERMAGIETPRLQVLDSEAENALRILDQRPIVTDDDIKTLGKILELEKPSSYVYHVLTPEARDFLRKKNMTLSDLITEPGFASYAKTRRLRSTVEAINEYTTQKYGMKLFEDDFLKAAIKRYHQHYRDLERVGALEDLSQVRLLDGSKVAIKVGDTVPEGYVRLGGPLKDWAVVQELHDDILNITRAFKEVDSNALARAVDRVMNLWRPFATIYNPGFHARNAYSNFWQLALKDGANAVSPARIRQSFRLLIGKDLDKTFRTATGELVTGREILAEARRLDIIQRMAAFRGVERSASIDEILDILAGKVSGNVFQRAARSLGRAIENHARLLGFMNDLLAGYTPMEAAMRTKKFLFDYSELTGFESRILRRIFPFYTWTRKNVPLQLKSLVQKPRQFAAFGHLEREMREASGEIEEEYTPEYFARLFAIPTPIRVGGKQFWWNPDLPIQDIQLLGDPRDILGMLSPVIKVPIELITNKSLFWGTPIRRSEWQKTEAPSFLHPFVNVPGIRNLLGLERILSPYRREGEERWTVGIDPVMSYLVQQWPLLANIAKWTAYTRPGERVAADIMSGVGGIKFFAYDPEVEKLRVAYENLNRLQEFMRYLEQQKGIDVPTQKDLVDFLRTVYGIPVPSRQTLGRFQPEVDYWSYLEQYLPLPAQEVTRFKKAVQAGEILVPTESEIEKVLAYLTGVSASQKKIEAQLGRPYIEYLMQRFGREDIPPEILQQYLQLLREGALVRPSPGPLSTVMRYLYGDNLSDLGREYFGIPEEMRVTSFERMAPSLAFERYARRRRRR